MYHRIHPFKIYHSLVLSVFRVMQHDHYVISGTPSLSAIADHSFLPPNLGIHHSTFCPCGFVYSGHIIHKEHIIWDLC